ncbi:MAG: hypothetical protein ACKOAH_22625, partial [Pirellula sp.]
MAGREKSKKKLSCPKAKDSKPKKTTETAILLLASDSPGLTSPFLIYPPGSLPWLRFELFFNAQIL